MAPMTRSFAIDGIPGPDIADYYGRRAENLVGLVLTESAAIDRPAARNEPNAPFFHGDKALAGWKHVVDAVHAVGGKIGPQLTHQGARPGQNTDWRPSSTPESPSGLTGPGIVYGEAMSEEAIADTIAAFAKAASNAKRLGFDLLEIQGSGGYLVDQFFWSGSNTRTDQFGGATIAARSSFAIEVIREIRKAVGSDFPICIRLSQFKVQDFTARNAHSPKEMEEWLLPLVEAGANLLHCTQRRFWEAEFPEVDGEKGLNLAGWAKKLTGAKTISGGSVGLKADFTTLFQGQGSAPASVEGLVERLEREEFDLVSVGRALIGDPAWSRKVLTGHDQELAGFDPSKLYALY